MVFSFPFSLLPLSSLVASGSLFLLHVEPGRREEGPRGQCLLPVSVTRWSLYPWGSSGALAPGTELLLPLAVCSQLASPCTLLPSGIKPTPQPTDSSRTTSAPAFRETLSSAHAHPLVALIANRGFCCFRVALFIHPRCFPLLGFS